MLQRKTDHSSYPGVPPSPFRDNQLEASWRRIDNVFYCSDGALCPLPNLLFSDPASRPLARSPHSHQIAKQSSVAEGEREGGSADELRWALPIATAAAAAAEAAMEGAVVRRRISEQIEGDVSLQASRNVFLGSDRRRKKEGRRKSILAVVRAERGGGSEEGGAKGSNNLRRKPPLSTFNRRISSTQIFQT